MKTNVSRKLFIIATMMSFMCLTINLSSQIYQTKMSADEHAKMTTNEMKNKLDLDHNQYQKVHEINLKYAKKQNELAASSANKKSEAKTMKSLHEEKEKELKGVLTSDQYKKYEGMEKEMKKEAKEKRKGERGRTRTR